MSHQQLQALDKAHVWHPFDLIKLEANVLIESGKGAWVYDHAGKAYLDAISSWWVNLHGHAHPELVEVLHKQAALLEHVIFAGFTHKPAIELASKLLPLIGQNHTRAFFSDNGSTAVEVAVKMAFQYWYNLKQQKTKIIAIEGAYHGDTFGAMSVGGKSPFNAPFAPFLFDVNYIPFPESEATVAKFKALALQNDVAAFIYEPLIQGSAGMRMYTPGTLDQLLSIAKEHQIICIADEVMTGFGRTGKLLASHYCENAPDIICLSKGITGGFMPLGLTTTTEEIHQAFVSEDVYKVFFHGHSYTGNPLACALACKSLELLVSESCQTQIAMITMSHQAFIQRNAASKHTFRTRGTILAIELHTGEQTSYFSNIRDRLYFYFLEKGIILRPLGNIIYILPPYCITEAELKLVYSAIEDCPFL